MSNTDVLKDIFEQLNNKPTMQPTLFTNPEPVPHLKPSNNGIKYHTCKFCGFKCHGDFGLAQHLSECLKDTVDPHQMSVYTRYNTKRLNALQIWENKLPKDAMVHCTIPQHPTSTCTHTHMDNGAAWVHHLLLHHTKQELVNNFTKQDLVAFKDEFAKHTLTLENVYKMSRRVR